MRGKFFGISVKYNQMTYLWGAFVFILGTIIGSFLNVVILRYNTGRSAVKGESQCFTCGKKLKWPDLFPIFSFLAFKGRCRHCKCKISWQYPVVELVTGLVFISVFAAKFSATYPISSLLYIAYALVVFCLLIIISAYDFKHQIIPNGCAYLLAGLALLPVLYKNLSCIGDWSALANLSRWQDFLAGIILASFFAFFWAVSRGNWMGLGDAKLALGVGWFLGLPKSLLALAFSFWIGAAAGVTLMIVNKSKYKINSAIPFGPFLALGAFLAFIFGDTILKDYLYYFYVV